LGTGVVLRGLSVAQRELGLVERQLGLVERQLGEEAGALAGVAGGSHLIHAYEQRVAVTVQRHGFDVLVVA
jgi:hypothetical protein